jgi:PTH1 family peptidyl-tRNA hydrolase
MKLIVGLGNPGSEYERTRHNVGSTFVRAFVGAHDIVMQAKSKFHADVAELSIAGQKVLFVVPTTYYNSSGEAVQATASFYKIAPEDILVIHDELALPFGTIRTRYGGSDAGNNGVKSVTAHVGEGTARIRIGIYNELREKMDDADFVLSRFSSDEQTKILQLAPVITSCIGDFIQGTLPHTTHNPLKTNPAS